MSERKPHTADREKLRQERRALMHRGPMYIDPKYKKPGFVYALPTTRPGEIEAHERLRYKIVKREMAIGDQVASSSSPLGSAVTIQSKCGALHVLMEITQEDFDLNQSIIEEDNQLLMSQIGNINEIPEQYKHGSTTIGHSRKQSG